MKNIFDIEYDLENLQSLLENKQKNDSKSMKIFGMMNRKNFNNHLEMNVKNDDEVEFIIKLENKKIVKDRSLLDVSLFDKDNNPIAKIKFSQKYLLGEIHLNHKVIEMTVYEKNNLPAIVSLGNMPEVFDKIFNNILLKVFDNLKATENANNGISNHYNKALEKAITAMQKSRESSQDDVSLKKKPS